MTMVINRDLKENYSPKRVHRIMKILDIHSGIRRARHYCNRSIVSLIISNRNDNKLVFDTFNEAIKTNPLAKPLLHSDRGFQYTSPTFKNLLNKQGMTQSMSRVACCLGNAPTEALWEIIKAEMYELYDVHDKESLIAAITKYIHFYNDERYQERFDYKIPMEVRK